MRESLLVLISCSVLGWVSAVVTGELLARISWDYVVASDEYLGLGARWGLMAGATFAFLNITGRSASLSRAALALVLCVAAIVSLIAIGGNAVLNYEMLVNEVVPQWRLPNPRRHALYLVSDQAVRTFPLVWILLGGGGILVARSRRLGLNTEIRPVSW